jgi:hypothetical protein
MEEELKTQERVGITKLNGKVKKNSKSICNVIA